MTSWFDYPAIFSPDSHSFEFELCGKLLTIPTEQISVERLRDWQVGKCLNHAAFYGELCSAEITHMKPAI